MKTKIKAVHQCDHCNKKLFVKPAMEKHERHCYKNPTNRVACEGCDFLKETKIEYAVDYYGQESMRTSRSFVCAKLNKVLFPRVVERKELHLKYPETFEGQEPMPRDCHEFKQYFTSPF